MERNFIKENKKQFKAIKTTTKQKFVTNLRNSEALRRLHIQQEIPRCVGYGPKALTYKATMHKLKSMFFPN